MLSDHERETLRAIQRQLFVDDPEFERSFRALEEPTPPIQYRWAYTIGIVIATLLAVLMLLAGSPGGFLAFAIIAGSVWLARHLEHAATQGKDGE